MLESNKKIKILLVDDREDNLLSIATILERDGYEFYKATSGKEALKILLKEQDFTLILMDVQMPGLNGFETAALINDRDRLRHIPIIFITAHDYSEDNVFKGYRTGGVDYIYKPINPDLLRAKVSVFVELYKKTHELLAQEQKLKAINDTLQKEVSERKKNEALLAEAQKMAHLGSWEWDTSTDTIYWSDELYRMFGYEPGSIEASFKLLLHHCHAEDLNNVAAVIKEACYTKEAFTLEHKIVRTNGVVRTVYGKGRLVAQGSTKFFGSLLDVTDIKDTQEQLRQKDEFISIASHELKTPLTSVKAYNQLLVRALEENNVEASKIYANKNEAYIGRLNALIEDLLNVSKIQAGKLQFNISEFDFDEMVNETIENIRHLSTDYKIKLTGNAGLIVKGDKQRLEQVLTNYLSNAIKYSPETKEVVVDVKKDKNEIRVAIQDFGIGIPKDKQEKIFDRFFRVEKTAQKFSGLGIGLYISSEIIKRHEGKTWVQSEEGKGSTFYISLPVA